MSAYTKLFYDDLIPDDDAMLHKVTRLIREEKRRNFQDRTDKLADFISNNTGIIVISVKEINKFEGTALLLVYKKQE